MKNRQNQSIRGEKRTVASRTGKGHKRTFRSDDSNLSGYRGFFKQPKRILKSVHFIIFHPNLKRQYMKKISDLLKYHG